MGYMLLALAFVPFASPPQPWTPKQFSYHSRVAKIPPYARITYPLFRMNFHGSSWASSPDTTVVAGYWVCLHTRVCTLVIDCLWAIVKNLPRNAPVCLYSDECFWFLSGILVTLAMTRLMVQMFDVCTVGIFCRLELQWWMMCFIGSEEDDECQKYKAKNWGVRERRLKSGVSKSLEGFWWWWWWWRRRRWRWTWWHSPSLWTTLSIRMAIQPWPASVAGVVFLGSFCYICLYVCRSFLLNWLRKNALVFRWRLGVATVGFFWPILVIDSCGWRVLSWKMNYGLCPVQILCFPCLVKCKTYGPLRLLHFILQ